jgi:hypothetical protein
LVLREKGEEVMKGERMRRQEMKVKVKRNYYRLIASLG